MFNPVIKEADVPLNCKRFTPREERSIFCRTCNRQFFKHSSEARKFDSVFEMHRAYMTDVAVIRWLWSVGSTLEEQIDVVQSILDANQEVVNAPDIRAMQAIISCLQQMKIEQDKNAPTPRCALCRTDLREDEEKICTACTELVAAGLPSEGAEGGERVQDALAAAAHDSQVHGGADLPIHAFD